MVQTCFLNKFNFLECSTQFVVQYSKVHYVYDCISALNLIQKSPNGEKSILFHFLKENHFAFDSMIYDEKLKIMVFIQIKFNKNHTDNFELIWNLIEDTKPICHKEEKMLEKWFDGLRRTNLVTLFGFQWLTNERFKEIELKKSSFLKDKTKKYVANKFQIFTHSKELIKVFNNE